MPRWVHRRRPVHPQEDFELDLSIHDKRKLVYSVLEAGGFPWRIVLAAGTGVFTYSYNVAALDFALPTLQYLYWHDNVKNEFLLNILSSVGLIFGSVCFGHLADRYGRRVAGSLALNWITFSILGFVLSSSGLEDSMSMLAWLCVWRIFLSIGAGALLPINSVVVAEWAPTRLRTKSLATMFLMLPLGQLLAASVSLAVSATFKKSEGVPSAKILDRAWRIIIGVGAIPAFIALCLRITTPETARYLLDVPKEIDRAYRDIQGFHKYHDAALGMSVTNMLGSEDQYVVYNEDNGVGLSSDPFSHGEILKYFVQQSNWRHLVGIATCWYLLSIALTSLDGGHVSTINILFHRAVNTTDVSITSAIDTTSVGTRLSADTQELADLQTFSWQYIVLISAGSIAGVLMSIPLLDHIRRRRALVFGFIALAISLLAVAIALSTSGTSGLQGATITFYILSYLLANLGPSILLVILSAEIFPTQYRATAFGISMSFGSFATLIMKIILRYTTNRSLQGSIHARTVILGVSVPVLTLATFFAWIWIPEVQILKDDGRRLTNKTLEELAEGAIGAERDGEVFGLRSRFDKELKPKLRFLL